MRFPLICGGSALGEERRDLRFARALGRAAGLAPSPELLRAVALPLACAEAEAEYVANQTTPLGAFAQRGLERWEAALGLPSIGTQQERQARAAAARGPIYLRDFGTINVNTTAALLANGYDLRLIATVFLAVSDHADANMAGALLTAPAHVDIGVGRRGFWCDDPGSLVDRDCIDDAAGPVPGPVIW